MTSGTWISTRDPATEWPSCFVRRCLVLLHSIVCYKKKITDECPAHYLSIQFTPPCRFYHNLLYLSYCRYNCQWYAFSSIFAWRHCTLKWRSCISCFGRYQETRDTNLSQYIEAWSKPAQYDGLWLLSLTIATVTHTSTQVGMKIIYLRRLWPEIFQSHQSIIRMQCCVSVGKHNSIKVPYINVHVSLTRWEDRSAVSVLFNW